MNRARKRDTERHNGGGRQLQVSAVPRQTSRRRALIIEEPNFLRRQSRGYGMVFDGY